MAPVARPAAAQTLERLPAVPPVPPALTLAALLADVEQHNPRLRGLHAQVRAAGERPVQASTLEDPTLMTELWQVPFDRSSVPLMFTLRQPLPWPGKLRARAAALVPEADRARADADTLRIELRRQTGIAYYEYRLAVRSQKILQQLHDLLADLVAAVEARYRVGRAELTELLTARQAVINLANLLLDTGRERDLAATTLNMLRGESPDAPLGEPSSAPPVRPSPSAAWLFARALEKRPELRALKASAAQAQARVQAAQRERAPDLAVWASVMKDLKGPQDTFTVGVQTSIPSFSLAKHNAAAREGLFQAQAVQAEQQAMAVVIRGEVHKAVLRLETTLRHLALHSGSLIPLSEQAAQAAQAGFQSGRVPLSMLLEAQRTLSEHHLEYERYLAECGQRWAELEAAVGAPVLDAAAPDAGAAAAAGEQP